MIWESVESIGWRNRDEVNEKCQPPLYRLHNYVRNRVWDSITFLDWTMGMDEYIRRANE